MTPRQCRHPRPKFHEERSSEAVYEFENGEVVNDYSREGNPTGVVFVSCPDCGYGRRFVREAAMPKWVRLLAKRVYQ